MKAYLMGKLRVELRDIRKDEQGVQHAVMAFVVVDDEGNKLCDMEPGKVYVGNSMAPMDAITLVPVPGRLSGGEGAEPATA